MCVSVPVSQSLTVGTGVSPGRGLGGRDGMAVWLLAITAGLGWLCGCWPQKPEGPQHLFLCCFSS